jgi:hypothetical protein
MDGLELDTGKAEGKMIAAMVELLGDVTKRLADVEETTIAISDELDEIEEDLDAIEDFIMDEDEDDYDDLNDEEEYEFDEDGEAEIEAVAKGEFPIDEYTNICLTLELDVDLTWTLNGNTLSLLPTGIDIDVENLSVKPYNAMYAEILGMLEAELEAQFRNGSDDMAQSFAAEDSEIILLNDTTLKYRVNNGNVVVCTRML